MHASAGNAGDTGAGRARRRLTVVAIVCAFALPALLLALVLRHAMLARAADHAPAVRLVLPDGNHPIDLPPIEGPADASRPLVVIDPGHGGHDPGASGPGGIKEKALTLALAMAVHDALIADGHVRVAMTRRTDRFLALEERSGIAQRLHADLFLSIHADAADAPDARGATIYTLSDRGSDALADAVAQRENRVDVVNGVSLAGRGNAVAQILVDLAQQRMRAQSAAFAELIRREGEGHVHFRDKPLQQAAFVVLKSLDLPSVLLEAGYISNADEARAMQTPAWRTAFGASVARAMTIALASRSN